VKKFSEFIKANKGKVSDPEDYGINGVMQKRKQETARQQMSMKGMSLKDQKK
jgi:hypothetical protein